MSDRNKIVREPGHLVYDGATFYSEKDITVEPKEETIELVSDRFGKFDNRPVGRMVEIKMTPQQFNASALAKLYPFGALRMGASILPTTDKPIDIHTVSGKRYRIPCGFIYKEPASTWSVKKPILGEVTLYGILGIDADPGALASFLAQTSVAYPGDTTWDPYEVITPACEASWTQASGPTDWDDIDTAEGFVITPEAELVEDKPDGRGLINIAIKNYKVTAQAEPMNISSALVMAALGFGRPLGSSKAAIGRDLVINSSGAYARLYNAVLKDGAPHRFGAENRNISGLTWEAMASFNNGSKNPLFGVFTEDPDAEEG